MKYLVHNIKIQLSGLQKNVGFNLVSWLLFLDSIYIL
jgi:hypothetical protein